MATTTTTTTEAPPAAATTAAGKPAAIMAGARRVELPLLLVMLLLLGIVALKSSRCPGPHIIPATALPRAQSGMNAVAAARATARGAAGTWHTALATTPRPAACLSTAKLAPAGMAAAIAGAILSTEVPGTGITALA